MQLRTHPKMKWEGFSNWPPAWGGSYGRGDVFPIGEDGVLTNVEMAEADSTTPRHLTLTIEHRGNTSSGVLCCDDEEVIPRPFKILKSFSGWTICRIGDLDVDL
jgi:hypothetical protein